MMPYIFDYGRIIAPILTRNVFVVTLFSLKSHVEIDIYFVYLIHFLERYYQFCRLSQQQFLS